MTEEIDTCGPKRPDDFAPTWIGRRFWRNFRQRANKTFVSTPATKLERRILRKRGMDASTRPIEAKLAEVRRLKAQIRAMADNGHAARRLLAAEAAWRRAKREEARLQLKMSAAVATSAKPSSAPSGASPATAAPGSTV